LVRTYPSEVRMIPEPTPVAEPPPNRPFVATCEVIVRTELRAAATIPVMSPCWIVVVPAEPVVVVFALDVGLGVTTAVVAAGDVRPRIATVEPDAKMADRRAAARIVPTVPRRGWRRLEAGGVGVWELPPVGGGAAEIWGFAPIEPQVGRGSSAGRPHGEAVRASVPVGRAAAAWLGSLATPDAEVVYTGAGSSYYLAIAAAAAHRALIGRPAIAVPTSELLIRPGSVLGRVSPANRPIVAFSRSGSTTEVVRLIERAVADGRRTIGITCGCGRRRPGGRPGRSRPG